ncbi:hypothetical protein BJV93_003609 [Clostridium butyricum]|nr:hypothetical protein [Clostridium butyricum]
MKRLLKKAVLNYIALLGWNDGSMKKSSHLKN